MSRSEAKPLVGARRIAAVLVAALSFAAPTAEAADPAPELVALFKKQCGVCHVAEPEGKKRQGPNLWGVIGRRLGSVEGFKYSKGLAADERVWTAELLDQWLTDPKAVFPDSFMIYKQPDAEIRRQIISFLETRKE